MKIKTILSQHRRDFTAKLECESCNNEQELSGGYDDAFFHENVIPKIKCKSCGATASDNYRPLATKYEASQVI